MSHSETFSRRLRAKLYRFTSLVMASLLLVFSLVFYTTAQASAPGAATNPPLKFESYSRRPKLVVVIVIDQFRADYLTRFSNKFLPALGKSGDVGGFKYLMTQGAYFPMAHFDLLQNMTCPGHAAILTGASPSRTGIPLNDWFDPSTGQTRYCVRDDVDELSPRVLQGTTVGDELKNAGYDSKVISVALKDRAAILLGGHRSDLSFWLSTKGLWITSPYYTKQLPTWLIDENKRVAASLGQNFSWQSKEFKKGAADSLATPYGVDITTDAGLSAVAGFSLGKSKSTDLLTMSYSSHDLQGHETGPNSPEMESLTLHEDKEIARLLNGLRKNVPGGLRDVVIVLTADHGVSPKIADLNEKKIAAGFIDAEKVMAAAEQDLTSKFGAPKSKWLAAVHSFNFYFSPDAFEQKKIDRISLESRLKSYLAKQTGVAFAFSRSDVESGFLPAGESARQIGKSYVAGKSGDVVLVPKPFYMEVGKPVNHMTGYSYDRSVPLIISGLHIRKGVYADAVDVQDLAPTLSFLTGVIAPAQSEGRVLSEIFGD